MQLVTYLFFKLSLEARIYVCSFLEKVDTCKYFNIINEKHINLPIFFDLVLKQCYSLIFLLLISFWVLPCFYSPCLTYLHITINPQTISSSSQNKIKPLIDSHSIQITNIWLNGDNFLQLSKVVWMYIRCHGKIGYMTGETKASTSTYLASTLWDAENSMVMMWLVHSMENDISSNYMCYSIS